MIKNKPLKFLDRVVSYIIAIICISAGSIGLFLSVYNYQSIVFPIAAVGFIIIGILYGIAAFKGKPINFSKLNKTNKNI
jgi:hypothetical protein